MADTNQLTGNEHILEEPRKMPEMIKVLSILTFIGSGLALINNFYSFAAAQRIYNAGMAAQEKMADMPGWVKGLQGPDPIGTMQRTYDNRVAILILGVLASVLCIVGAVQMRKLKKTGFYIYLIGEILPLLIIYIFIGTSALSGFMLIITLAFMALFIVLYATQLKYLK